MNDDVSSILTQNDGDITNHLAKTDGESEQTIGEEVPCPLCRSRAYGSPHTTPPIRLQQLIVNG